MVMVRIAVVDDEEPVRRALARLLRTAGLDPQCFVSGQDFLDAVATEKPSCVILDLHMPGLSGLQVLDRLRSSDAMVPAIVITGYDEPDHETRCMALGAVAFMRKPIDDHQLLQTIDRAVEGNASVPQ